MPGLDYKKLPAGRDEERDFLQQQYNTQARALEQTPMSDVQFSSRILKLQADTRNKWRGIKKQRRVKFQETERVRNLVQRGTTGMSREDEAALRMQLGPEAERLVFPKEKSITPFSPSRLRSYRLDIVEYADAAIDKRGFEWGPPKKTKQSLLQQYMRWRDGVAYDELDPINQHLLDNEWDSLMRGDDVFKEWWTDKKKRTPVAEATSLRSTGQLNSSIKKRVVGSALSEGRLSSPVDMSVKKTLSSYYKVPRSERPPIWEYTKQKEKLATPIPTPEQLKRLNTKQAYDEGVRLGYWL